MEQQIQFAGKKFYTTSELEQIGLSYYMIHRQEEAGRLRRINNSCYESNEYTGDVTDFMIAMAFVPNGVICTMSAAVHYGLSTYRPNSVDVAIGRSQKVSTLPDWPSIQLHWFEKSRLGIGLVEYEEYGQRIRIFDIEKTVIDVISLRSQIGIEETKEILTNYLRRSDRNINQLYRYAEQLRCKKTLETYMEVLV